jgi:nucleoside-diphosphate-sugar epimerase
MCGSLVSDAAHERMQPTSYMQNMNMQHAAEKQVLLCGYSPTTLQGFVDLEDVAEVARLVLLDPAPHNRARYDLVGENLSLDGVAKTIERVSGISGVKPTMVPRDEAVKRGVVRATIESDYARETLERLMYYYDKRYGSEKRRACGLWSSLMHNMVAGASQGTATLCDGCSAEMR